MQRLAQDAVRDGLTHVDQLLSRRKRPRRAEAALIADGSEDRRSPGAGRRPVLQPVAVQPRDQRAAPARLGLQAVRVSGGVRAGRRRRPDRFHAGHVVDDSRPRGTMTRRSGRRELRGPVRRTITLRRALALSRNIATIKVAEKTGFDRRGRAVARLGVGTTPQGVSVDRARRLRSHADGDRHRLHDFPNGGTIGPLRALVARRQRRRDVRASRARRAGCARGGHDLSWSRT